MHTPHTYTVYMLQPSLLLGHVLIVSGDFTVTSIMTVVLCPATASVLKRDTSLTELRVWGYHIDAEEMSYLAPALRDNTTLRVLDLSYNTVDSRGAEHLGKLSGRVWGYGLTCNIRQCQCVTSNREMSVVQNVNADLRWSNAPVLRYCGPLLLVCLLNSSLYMYGYLYLETPVKFHLHTSLNHTPRCSKNLQFCGADLP